MSKKNIILLTCSIIFLIIAIIVFVFATSKDSSNIDANITNKTVSPLPENKETFIFSDKDGKNYSLNNFNDKPIALILWSSDSENALDILENSIETFENSEFKDSINLLIVNTKEPNSDIKEIVERCNFSVPIYYDSESTSANEYTFTKLPHLVFIKEDGTISNELNPNQTGKTLTQDVFEANLELLLFEEENKKIDTKINNQNSINNNNDSTMKEN